MTTFKSTGAASTNRLIVVCEANSNVGFGHFFRCLHLVDALRTIYGISSYWVGNFDASLSELLSDRGYFKVDAVDIDGAIAQTLSLSARAVLCDTYKLTEEHTKKLHQQFKVCVIDDFGNTSQSSVDTIINFTVAANRYKYTAKQQLLGPRYFLCNNALDRVRKIHLSQAEKARETSNVLIAIGGHDRLSIGPHIADILSLNKQYGVTLLGAYSSLTNIKRYQHIIRTQDMASLYEKADLVVSGGGLIKYESAYCGVPNIVVAQTPEQYAETLAFQNANLCYAVGSAATAVRSISLVNEVEENDHSAFNWSSQELIETADKALKERKHLVQASCTHFEDNATARTAAAIFDEHYAQE